MKILFAPDTDHDTREGVVTRLAGLTVTVTDILGDSTQGEIAPDGHTGVVLLLDEGNPYRRDPVQRDRHRGDPVTTNLHPGFPVRDSIQYEVTNASLPVYVRLGTVDSNTYFGSSMALGTVWQRLALLPGDQVTATPYQVWGVPGGEQRRELRFALSDKHPFEKVYLTRPEEWPLDRLQVVTDASFTHPVAASFQFDRDELTGVGAVRYGRGIDMVIPEEHADALFERLCAEAL